MKDRHSYCEEADRWMQKALDSTLSPAERDALDRHMESCPACAEAWQQHRALSRLATGWARRPSLGEEGADKFVAELLTRIETRPARPFWAARRWALSMTAACALLLVAILSWFIAPSVPPLPAIPPASAIGPVAIPHSPSALLPHGGIDSLREWLVQGVCSLPSASSDAWNTLTGEPVSAVPALVALAVGLVLAAVLAAQTTSRRRLT